MIWSMPRFSFTSPAWTLALLPWLCASVACVSDEPAQAGRPLPDSGTTVGNDASNVSDAGGALDAVANKCAAPEVSCGGMCVDTRTAPQHCGRCDRSCGGGTCSAGVCSAATVRENIEGLMGFAIEGTQMYFTQNNFGPPEQNLVFSCATDACAGASTQLATMAYQTLGIEVNSGFIYFESAGNKGTQRQAIFRCPVAGCPESPVAVISATSGSIDGFRAFSESVIANTSDQGLLDAECIMGVCKSSRTIVAKPVGAFTFDLDRIYFGDQTGGMNQLKSCLRSQVPCVDRTLVSTSPVKGAIALAQDLLFFISTVAANASIVAACPLTGGCGATPAQLTKVFAPIENLAADAAGIYWTSDDALLMCANAACVGGPKLVATGVTGASLLRLEKSYVYFAIPGTPKAKSIKRIAR
jgi:Stigma-specific protein, Stig1